MIIKRDIGWLIVFTLFLSGCGSSNPTGLIDDGRVQGATDANVVDQVISRAPLASSPDNIVDGVILTRLDVVLDPTATVGQVNAALEQIGAKIVTSQSGSPMVTVEVARQADASKLADIAAQLTQLPGIITAFTGKEAQTRAIPDFANASPPVDNQSIAFLQNSKFPAAWNAGGLLNDCLANPVNLIIVDKFGSLSSMGAAMRARIAKEFPQYTLKGSVLDDGEAHGWNVAAIAAAEFSTSDSTGAMPFSGCLNLTLLSVSGLTYSQQLTEIATFVRTLGSAPAILNYSLGFKDRCDTGCTTATVADGSKLNEFKAITSSSERAWMALGWKLTTRNIWNQLVIVTAAGDEAGQELSRTYRALGIARYNSALSYVTDSDFIASTQTNWGADTDPGAKFIQTDSTELAKLRRMESFLASAGVDKTPASNVIMVGQGAGSPSDSGVSIDVSAQNLPDLSGKALVSGSSFAAPQVSGLAAYLWALDGIGLRDAVNVLATAPVIHAIVNSAAIDASTGDHQLDALAAALSLDSDAASEPPQALVRAAMLDFNDDGFFNQDDLTLFANVANLSTAPDAFTQSTEVAFNRLNLHGMGGLSGVLASGKFDLDVENSNYLGAANYSTVNLKIGTDEIALDENNISNTQILCYYAYSPLYLGDEATRDKLLPPGVCGGTGNVKFISGFWSASVSASSDCDAVTTACDSSTAVFDISSDSPATFTGAGGYAPLSDTLSASATNQWGDANASGVVNMTVTPDPASDTGLLSIHADAQLSSRTSIINSPEDVPYASSGFKGISQIRFEVPAGQLVSYSATLSSSGFIGGSDIKATILATLVNKSNPSLAETIFSTFQPGNERSFDLTGVLSQGSYTFDFECSLSTGLSVDAFLPPPNDFSISDSGSCAVDLVVGP